MQVEPTFGAGSGAPGLPLFALAGAAGAAAQQRLLGGVRRELRGPDLLDPRLLVVTDLVRQQTTNGVQQVSRGWS
jgi:hypothetical protein